MALAVGFVLSVRLVRGWAPLGLRSTWLVSSTRTAPRMTCLGLTCHSNASCSRLLTLDSACHSSALCSLLDLSPHCSCSRHARLGLCSTLALACHSVALCLEGLPLAVHPQCPLLDEVLPPHWLLAWPASERIMPPTCRSIGFALSVGPGPSVRLMLIGAPLDHARLGLPLQRFVLYA